MKKIKLPDYVIENVLEITELADAERADYLLIEHKSKGINEADETDIQQDRLTFGTHVGKIEKNIPIFKSLFIDVVTYDKEVDAFWPTIQVVLPYLTWLGDDKDVITKLISGKITHTNLKSFHFLNFETLVNNLLKLAGTHGIEIQIEPIFQSILSYNLSKITEDIFKFQKDMYGSYGKSKQVSSAKIYFDNLQKRLKSNNGVLPKFVDKTIDTYFLKMIDVIKEKYGEFADVNKILKEMFSSNFPEDALASAIIKHIKFDNVIFKGDKKYEVLFNLYKDVLKQDFLLKDENEVDQLEGYTSYTRYKRNYIKSAIFKKQNLLNPKSK